MHGRQADLIRGLHVGFGQIATWLMSSHGEVRAEMYAPYSSPEVYSSQHLLIDTSSVTQSRGFWRRR